MTSLPRRYATAATAVLALALAIPASPAQAAPSAGQGWVRLGHFSPDTKEVDVRLTALRGGSIVLELSDVGYGDISSYQPLDDGTYAVAMVPAGAGTWDVPAISSEITVRDGSAATVAAYGPNSGLQVRAFDDDLAQPAADKARIRVIQASTRTPTVDVATTTGVAIANDARRGSATDYADVDPGSWVFRLTGRGVGGEAQVDVAAGTISTLFVLDTADGGLTLLPVLDSAAAAVTPEGGVQTGGGWLAQDVEADVWNQRRLVERMRT
jgi:hypothetical protein